MSNKPVNPDIKQPIKKTHRTKQQPVESFSGAAAAYIPKEKTGKKERTYQ